MITPKFNVTQTNDFVTITIHTPYVKAQSVDILVEEDEVRFNLPPYYLRLTLPGHLIEDERSVAKYDISSGDFLLTIAKAIPGQDFPELDLLSKLLANKSDPSKTKNLIEVLESNDIEAPPTEVIEDLEDFDWEIEQTLQPDEDITLMKPGYGFNNIYTGIFQFTQETPNDINELPQPETMSFSERTKFREEQETLKFDEDYYVSDYMSGKEPDFQPILKFKSKWAKTLRDLQKDKVETIAEEPTRILIEPIQASASNLLIQDMTDQLKQTHLEPQIHNNLKLNEKDEELLLKLPKKQHLLNQDEIRTIYLAMVDILLSYCYDQRINDEDFNVESTWTIGKLSSSMACLDRFFNLKQVLVAQRRRILCYPLYRHFELGQKVVLDCYYILRLGRRAILKVFLELKQLFDFHPYHYRYSKIWIDDLIIFIQMTASDEVIKSLAHQVHHTQITKDDLTTFDLETLDHLADSGDLVELS